eukprot:6237438-Amphidinium_carterae.2
MDSGGTVAHARERTALAASLAAASVRTFKRVYTSSEIPMKVKANLCIGTYTIPQLAYASATQKDLDKTTSQVYGVSYLHSWKACLGKSMVRNGNFVHLTADEILNMVNKPSWRVHLDAAILRLAIHVVKSSCPILRAALSAVEFTSGSWWVSLEKLSIRLSTQVGPT